MRKRNKKNKYLGILFIIIAAAFVLGGAGVTYAQWTDSLEVTNIIKTGKGEPKFCNERISWKDKAQNVGLKTEFLNNKQIHISGTINDKYNNSLHYCVVNAGQFSLRYKGDAEILFTTMPEEANPKNNKNVKGIKLNITHPNDSLDPSEVLYNENGSPKLEINVENNAVKGRYVFFVTIPFTNGEKLTITGDVTVI